MTLLENRCIHNKVLWLLHLLLGSCVAEPASALKTEPVRPTVAVVTLPPDSVILGFAPDVLIWYDLTVEHPQTTFTTLLLLINMSEEKPYLGAENKKST